MSIKCRLKGRSHGEDGKKAAELIKQQSLLIRMLELQNNQFKVGLTKLCDPSQVVSYGDPQVLRDYAKSILKGNKNVHS